MNGWRQRITAALVTIGAAAVFSACGGGGAADVPPPANRAPVAQAGAPAAADVGSPVALDGRASSDADGDALAYAWQLSTAPAGSAATIANASSAQATLAPDVAGSYTVTLTVTDGRGGSASSSVTVTAAPASPPVIVLDQAEPLAGTVWLSLGGSVAGSVTWYVDLAQLGGRRPAESHAMSWDTRAAANGPHQIIARIESPSGAVQEIRRTVAVSNSTISLSAVVSRTSGTINVDVSATSTHGISAVSARFDGVDAGALTQPNACAPGCSGANNVYRFVVDGIAAGSGAHRMVVVATDGAGSSRTITVDVPIANPPMIALTAPGDGAFVFGTLRVAGTASSDKPGPVTVTARLGDLPIALVQGPPFGGSLDLSGVTPGRYTLTIRAVDAAGQAMESQRAIVVASSPARAHVPSFALPADAWISATDGTQVLTSTGDGHVVLRELVAGTAVTLSGTATLRYATDWQISGGRVYAQAQDTDCTLSFVCIYEWDGAGVRRNLSAASPHTAGSRFQENPVATGGHVVWTNASGTAGGTYTLLDVQRQAHTLIVPPAPVNYPGNTQIDLAVSGGIVHFVYWGQTGGSGMASQFDVFTWASDTGVSTRVTSGGARHIYPQTDGHRLAWQQTPVGGTDDGTFMLVTRALAGGVSTTVSGKATRFRLRDGVLAWQELLTPTSLAVKAWTAGTTTTLSTLSSTSLIGSTNGRVVYTAGGKVYSWHAASGATTLLLDVMPSNPFVAGGALVFAFEAAVYRVPLE